VWGKAGWGGTGAPDDSGYIKIYSNSAAFAAIKAEYPLPEGAPEPP
jgi:hypothetical protein